MYKVLGFLGASPEPQNLINIMVSVFFSCFFDPEIKKTFIFLVKTMLVHASKASELIKTMVLERSDGKTRYEITHKSYM